MSKPKCNCGIEELIDLTFDMLKQAVKENKPVMVLAVVVNENGEAEPFLSVCQIDRGDVVKLLGNEILKQAVKAVATKRDIERKIREN